MSLMMWVYIYKADIESEKQSHCPWLSVARSEVARAEATGESCAVVDVMYSQNAWDLHAPCL